MNKLTKIAVVPSEIAPALGATASDIGAMTHDIGRHLRPTDAAGAPNRVTYSYRTAPCSHHDTATATSCDECDRGEVDCVCADCAYLAPLNDAGLCRYCNDASELTPVQMAEKWLCAGVLRNPEMRVEL